MKEETTQNSAEEEDASRCVEEKSRVVLRAGLLRCHSRAPRGGRSGRLEGAWRCRNSGGSSKRRIMPEEGGRSSQAGGHAAELARGGQHGGRQHSRRPRVERHAQGGERECVPVFLCKFGTGTCAGDGKGWRAIWRHLGHRPTRGGRRGAPPSSCTEEGCAQMSACNGIAQEQSRGEGRVCVSDFAWRR